MSQQAACSHHAPGIERQRSQGAKPSTSAPAALSDVTVDQIAQGLGSLLALGACHGQHQVLSKGERSCRVCAQGPVGAQNLIRNRPGQVHQCSPWRKTRALFASTGMSSVATAYLPGTQQWLEHGHRLLLQHSLRTKHTRRRDSSCLQRRWRCRRRQLRAWPAAQSPRTATVSAACPCCCKAACPGEGSDAGAACGQAAFVLCHLCRRPQACTCCDLTCSGLVLAAATSLSLGTLHTSVCSLDTQMH